MIGDFKNFKKSIEERAEALVGMNEKQMNLLTDMERVVELLGSGYDARAKTYSYTNEVMDEIYARARGSVAEYIDLMHGDENDEKVPLLRIDTFKDHVKVYENGESVRCKNIRYCASIDSIPEVTMIKNVGDKTTYCAWRDK